jgi:cell division protein FtsL
MLKARRIACLCLLSVAAVALTGGSSSASLVDRYQSGQQRASQLRSKIRAESQQIDGYQGSIASLQSRLTVAQRSVAS